MPAPDMDAFHVVADLLHTTSKCILIWAIHSNRSAEGVSLLTQLLYLLVFVTRYLDLFSVELDFSYWNFTLKILYISSSAYIVFLMMRVFARSREREFAWKLAFWCLLVSLVGSPVVSYFCQGWTGWNLDSLWNIVWTFSIILESLCVLPQLLLLRQTNVPTVLDSLYLVTLGLYRFMYLLSWIHRTVHKEYSPPASVIFGVLQIAFYADFAWVYWSRQRVKLRGGGIVDSDDLSKSFLVKRFIERRRNRNSSGDDEDITDEDAGLAGQENGVIRPSNRGWGPRGVSVSADDTLEEHMNGSAGDAQMVDPSHFEDDDDDDDDDVDAPPPQAKDSSGKPATPPKGTDDAAGSSAGEWQENVPK